MNTRRPTPQVPASMHTCGRRLELAGTLLYNALCMYTHSGKLHLAPSKHPLLHQHWTQWPHACSHRAYRQWNLRSLCSQAASAQNPHTLKTAIEATSRGYGVGLFNLKHDYTPLLTLIQGSWNTYTQVHAYKLEAEVVLGVMQTNGWL